MMAHKLPRRPVVSSGFSRRTTRHPIHVCSAHRRGGWGSERNYYEVLGVPRTATEGELKAAFRRKAKELHPDVNKEDGAHTAFIEASEAYELLSDPRKRSEYDSLHGIRRVNFFQDVEEDEYGDRPSPFDGWAARPGDYEDDDGMDSAGGWWRRQQEGGRPTGEREGRFGWDRFGGARRGRGRRPGQGSDEEEEEEEEGAAPSDDDLREAQREAERLEHLMNMMGRLGPDGPLRRWQRGEIDPWGTSTSDKWAERVRQQQQDPFGNRGRGMGFDRGMQGVEWAPPGRGRWGGDEDARRPPGWMPDRGSEWRPTRRPEPGDNDDGGRGGRLGREGGGARRGWGDDGGFRGKPL